MDDISCNKCSNEMYYCQTKHIIECTNCDNTIRPEIYKAEQRVIKEKKEMLAEFMRYDRFIL